jgi:hypothetical protein
VRLPAHLPARRGLPTWVAAVLAGLAALLAACGAPSYTYVKNSADNTYFKVPTSWRPVDQQALAKALGAEESAGGESGAWMVAYDAAENPSPSHLIEPDTEEPIVYASVRRLPPQARGQVSFDTLRDLLLPVTSAARAGQNPQTSVFTDFRLVEESVLTPGNGIRGVHAVFHYRVQGGPPQTFDQTSYVNDDASKVYVLLVRCSAECYEQRRDEIQDVVSSFTVREAR